jgi:putative peptide zinc metalloprotease protein
MMEQVLTQSAETIGADAHVAFYPLFFVPPLRKQEEWRVGLERGALAIELPEEGVRGIQHLLAGKSIGEAAAALRQEYDEAVDIADLVQELAQLGFIERIGTQTFGPPEIVGQRWLQSIPPASIAWLYCRPALLIAGAIILLGPVLLLLDPTVRPQAHDLLWSSSYTLDLVMLLVLGPLLILKHELGHLFAARAKGVSGELTFGHRLFYLVAVSRLGGIWKLRRFDRLVIYCAGMMNDCIIASLCLLLLFTAQYAHLPLPHSLEALLRFLALSEYLGVAWEFQIFLKTDVYHIVADLTNRHDLPDQASALLRLGWQYLFRQRPPPQEQREQRHDILTLGYAALSIIGIGGSFLWLVFYLVPAMYLAVLNEIGALATGFRAMNVLAQLDSMAALLLQLLCFFLLGWFIARKRLHRAGKEA